MEQKEKQALRTVLKRKPFAVLTVSDSKGLCYRYQYDPLSAHGQAVRAPIAGSLSWRVAPGPIRSGEDLAEIAQGERRTTLKAAHSGRLGRRLLPEGAFAGHGAALAILYDADETHGETTAQTAPPGEAG